MSGFDVTIAVCLVLLVVLAIATGLQVAQDRAIGRLEELTWKQGGGRLCPVCGRPLPPGHRPGKAFP